MPDALNCLADYLSYEEGMALGRKLQEAEIPFWVKTCGPPSVPFGQGIFYRIFIAQENTPSAAPITENFLQERARNLAIIKCPRCKSEAVFKPEMLPFWQRIYYVGTKVHKCESCGKRFAR
jgi:DNA-directed RNA polymerase subunit RPC12/RpoP